LRADARDEIDDRAASIAPHSPVGRNPAIRESHSSGLSKARGTVVYSIDALGDDTGGCKSYTGAAELPAPTISVTTALTQIATNAGNFYNQPTQSAEHDLHPDRGRHRDGHLSADVGYDAVSCCGQAAPLEAWRPFITFCYSRAARASAPLDALSCGR
jgi:hypothetical protein